MMENTINHMRYKLDKYEEMNDLLVSLEDNANVTVMDEENSGIVDIHVEQEVITDLMLELAKETPGSDNIEYNPDRDVYIFSAKIRSDP